jgi:hypothetical protein
MVKDMEGFLLLVFIKSFPKKISTNAYKKTGLHLAASVPRDCPAAVHIMHGNIFYSTKIKVFLLQNGAFQKYYAFFLIVSCILLEKSGWDRLG